MLQLHQQGLRLSFVSQPPLTTSPMPFALPEASSKGEHLLTEILSMLERGAIQRVANSPFRGFTVCCLCTLREWEALLGDRSAVILLSPGEGEVSCGDACKSLALHSENRLGSLCGSDGCLISCLIHPLPRKFVCVLYQDEVFQFWVLPFGPLVSPRFFICVADAMMAHVRSLGLQIHHFLDIWLLQVKDFRSQTQHLPH